MISTLRNIAIELAECIRTPEQSQRQIDWDSETEHLGTIYPEPGAWHMNYIGPKSIHWYYDPPRTEDGTVDVEGDWSSVVSAHLQGDLGEPAETVEFTVAGERVFVVAIEPRDVPDLAQTPWPSDVGVGSVVKKALRRYHEGDDPTTVSRPQIEGERKRLGL